jgi:hypothetical protein
MILIAQLTARQPEIKLLIHGAYVNCSILSKQLNTKDPNQPPLNIGWRIIDRSQTAASPDCLVLANHAEHAEMYQLQPMSEVMKHSPHNLKEFCVNTGDYQLAGYEQVTVLLEIDTAV